MDGWVGPHSGRATQESWKSGWVSGSVLEASSAGIQEKWMGGWVGGWVGMSGADGMQESWKSGRLFGWVGKKDPKYRSCILESKTTRIFKNICNQNM